MRLKAEFVDFFAFRMYGRPKNRLAKLGDAIAISKSETIND